MLFKQLWETTAKAPDALGFISTPAEELAEGMSLSSLYKLNITQFPRFRFARVCVFIAKPVSLTYPSRAEPNE